MKKNMMMVLTVEVGLLVEAIEKWTFVSNTMIPLTISCAIILNHSICTTNHTFGFEKKKITSTTWHVHICTRWIYDDWES